MNMSCSNCDGTRIESGVAIGQSAEVGNIGPKYAKGIFMAVTQMYCDICLDCGEITRFFIKDLTERNWSKKPGSLGSK
jgi:hypothetical protein